MSEPKTDPVQQRMDEAMLEALAPVPLPAERQESVKQRLLARVRDSARDPGPGTAGIATVRADEGAWRSFLPKIQIKELLKEGDSMSYLLRLEPGAMLPPHDHLHTEECVVLEGEVRLGEHVVRRGDYHVARRGHPHGLLCSERGALLFLRGSVPSAKDVHWASVDAYAPLLPRALREKVGRWKSPLDDSQGS